MNTQSENALALRQLELKVMAHELALISKRLNPTPSVAQIEVIENGLRRARDAHARIWRHVEHHIEFEERAERESRNKLGLVLIAAGVGAVALALSTRSRS